MPLDKISPGRQGHRTRMDLPRDEQTCSAAHTTDRITSLDDSSFFKNSFRISEKSLNNRCVSPFFHLFQFAADIQEQPVQDQCCHNGEDRLRQDNIDKIITEIQSSPHQEAEYIKIEIIKWKTYLKMLLKQVLIE